jgi:hypothetical protein
VLDELSDAGGARLVAGLAAAARDALRSEHPRQQAVRTLVVDQPGRGWRRQPRRPPCPDELHANKGYDYPRCRRYLHKRGIKVRIARRGVIARTVLRTSPSSAGFAGIVERTISGLLRFKRLGLRYDRTAHTLRLSCSWR